MKNLIISCAALALLSCTGALNRAQQPNNQKEMENMASSHTSQNSLDWDGTYRGVLPCKDCEGLATTILLKKDLTFKASTQHLGQPERIEERAGKFNWNENGNTITLIPSGNDSTVRYLVGENTLTQLDVNVAAGEDARRFMLSKSNYEVLEKYWKLIELHGKAISADSTFIREPHLIFKESDNRVTGNGGCNNISGTYKIESINQIQISKLVSTKMACTGLAVESEFLKVLQVADNFSIAGDTLTLNKARMAPLARFKVVYMK
jgi:copper homeostasis protein (lipoprotein)